MIKFLLMWAAIVMMVPVMMMCSTPGIAPAVQSTVDDLATRPEPVTPPTRHVEQIISDDEDIEAPAVTRARACRRMGGNFEQCMKR